MEIRKLEKKANKIRKDIIKLIYHAKTGHTGGSLSSTDIMTALYYHVMKIDATNHEDPNRDRFVLSKGHSVEALWCILADKGFFPKEDLQTYSNFGSKLIGHPNNKVNGVEMNTGSLGHGLSVSNGMALAAKMDQKQFRVFTLMGDGEQAEGSLWEGAIFAAHYKLDNLVGIIDRNRLQISGSTEDVMGLDPLNEKWKSFGWSVVEINGNDMESLVKTFDECSTTKSKPTLIIANTTKGKGISFIENQTQWHHKVPTDSEYEQALAELEAGEEEINE
ncbi:MAG: transketolase [Clostridiales bacterium]